MKNLFLLSLFCALIACKSKIDSTKILEGKESETEQSSEGKNQSENKVPYETIANEKQANSINQTTEKEVQEVEDRIFFAYDSSDLDVKSKEVLDIQSAWLRSDETIKVTIEGHCDERGTREYNLALGEKRANSAKKYLVNSGVSETRIKTISYGKERPSFLGDSQENLAKNRRAVTVIN